MEIRKKSEEIIKIENLDFKYGDITILRDINVTIDKGDFCCIIGPNGSGKTTLLKNISRIVNPNKKSIFINGKDIRKYDNKEIATQMALVPQNTYIDFEFTVFDIVLMGRNPYINRFGKESEEDLMQVEDAMKKTNTWNLKDKNINKISGGEMQRAIIARAIAQQTDIILLDEPISHLDINHQIEILDSLRRYSIEENKTIVMVLHDLNLAAEYSSKILMLNKGQIVEKGSVDKVLTEQNVKQVYKLNFTIIKNPMTNKPLIIPFGANIGLN
ncbi:ABC transporter ATP-binding protein [Clostridium sediminicola]|uniref:ABC transporter ATP-binding protein n=1 Tax=Clostridium sediminicola TaxID=3114879 RepID=UPI0031F1DCB4